MPIEVSQIRQEGYKKIIQVKDFETQLSAIIAIHSTKLGPAVGGTRYYNYSSTATALADVLKLSKGMTYKAALAGINFGGGKSVIIGDPNKKTPELLRAFGKAVDSLNGEYVCAEDVNTTEKDMAIINETTKHVAGLAHTGGNPSPLTALGVFSCAKALARYQFKKDISQMKFAIQGVGNVGYHLCKLLRQAGATVFITDIDTPLARKVCVETGASFVFPDAIMEKEYDVFMPCAMGGILSFDNIQKMKCKAVCGSANNQLDRDYDAMEMKSRGITYCPDYLVNAGGIINVFYERKPGGYNKEAAIERINKLGDTLIEVLQIAHAKDCSPAKAADDLAEKRLKEASKPQILDNAAIDAMLNNV